MTRKFNSATEAEILEGKTSDVYFERSLSAASGVDYEGRVVSEFTVSGPLDTWVNFSGLDEVISILKDKPVNLYAIPEGTIVNPRDSKGIPIPFMRIEGEYELFGRLETAMIGFLCQSSGISTYSSRIRLILKETPFYSFGIRRMHPAISPMVDRAAYIGGADGVSGILGAELIGEQPVGTMPHSLALLTGDDRAWEITVEKAGKNGIKTVLIDTFMDEKFAALKVASMFPDLDYIRLDTPSSRRGNFANLIREVRWELDLRSHKNIKIMVSGGLKLEDLQNLKEAGAQAFGIGTSMTLHPFDFSMDIVEINGIPLTKRGKFSGSKNILRCETCMKLKTVPASVAEISCECGGSMKNLLRPFLINGNLPGSYDTPRQIRERTLRELESLQADH